MNFLASCPGEITTSVELDGHHAVCSDAWATPEPVQLLTVEQADELFVPIALVFAAVFGIRMIFDMIRNKYQF